MTAITIISNVRFMGIYGPGTILRVLYKLSHLILTKLEKEDLREVNVYELIQLNTLIFSVWLAFTLARHLI